MSRTILATLAVGVLLWGRAQGEERYYVENGVTYRETRERVQRPITEVVQQPTTRTIYREQYRTDFTDTVRVTSKPVTEWRLESYWRGRYNPFSEPYMAQRWVKRKRYEIQTQTVKEPVLRRELVAENCTEQVPVVTQRMVDEEVVRRVVVAAAPPTSITAPPPSITAPPANIVAQKPPTNLVVAIPTPARSADPFNRPSDSVAHRVQIGGISRLDGMPSRTLDTSGWQAGRTTMTR
jgi:hypothetical protein